MGKPPSGRARSSPSAADKRFKLKQRPASQNDMRRPSNASDVDHMAASLRPRPVSVQSMRDVDKVHIPAIDWFEKLEGHSHSTTRSRPASREAGAGASTPGNYSRPGSRAASSRPDSRQGNPSGEVTIKDLRQLDGSTIGDDSRPVSRVSHASTTLSSPDASYIESSFAAKAAIDVKQRQLEWRKRNLIGPNGAPLNLPFMT